MKIVTMCREGNTRSVSLRYILGRKLGHDVIACGYRRNRIETLQMLFRWADSIVILAERMRGKIPDEFQDKLRVYDVGPDRWGNPFDKELNDILVKFVNEDGFFGKLGVK